MSAATSSGSDRPRRETFPGSHRLSDDRDFQRVFDQRCSAGHPLLVVYAAKTKLSHARLGLTVSRKVGRAHVRNWWKRRIREVFRKRIAHAYAGYDLVVIPRSSRRLPPIGELEHALIRTTHRAVARVEGPDRPSGCVKRSHKS